MAKIKKLPSIERELPLISDKEHDSKDEIKVDYSNMRNIYPASNHFMKNILLYEEMMELFPDIELSGEIHVSSILNPNDATDIAIRVNAETPMISPPALADINEIIREEITSYYHLDKRSYRMLWERNVTYGAYCEMILNNETVVSHVDNAFKNGVERSLSGESYTLKDLVKDIGVHETVICTDFQGEELISFTDDPEIVLAKSVMSDIGEAIDEKSLSKYWLDQLFRDLSYVNTKDTDAINSSDTKSSMRPLHKRIPPEAVIPIIKKSDPSNHLDYLILLDGNGEPINHVYKNKISDEVKDPAKLEIKLTSQATISSTLTKARMMQSVMSENTPNVDIDLDTVKSVIDATIRKKFKDVNSVDLIDPHFMEFVMDVMLTRVLAKQKTKILYVKKENLAYMARRYDKNGMGKSILDQLFYNTSMRALLETATISAQIQNSIPRKKYSVTLDPDDQQPDKTKSMLMDYILNSEQSILPTGLLAVPDLTKWVGSIGVIAEFKHPKLPDITVSLEENSKNIPTPDSAIFDKLTEKVAMKFGITPEMLENGRSADFAITEIYKNSLQAKRMLREQEEYELDVSSYVSKLVRNDGIILSRIKNVLNKEENNIRKILGNKPYIKNLGKDEIIAFLIDRYFAVMKITYPKPDTIADGKIKDKYDDFVNVAKDFLDLRLNSDAIPESIFKDFSTSLDELKDMLVGVLATRWMKRNNYMPELVGLFTTQENGGHNAIESVLSEHESFILNLEDSFLKYLKEIKKPIRKNENRLEKFGTADNDENDDNTAIEPGTGDNTTGEE